MSQDHSSEVEGKRMDTRGGAELGGHMTDYMEKRQRGFHYATSLDDREKVSLSYHSKHLLG